MTTVQGAEWTSASAFKSRAEAFADIGECNDLACLQSWASQNGVDFTHVFLPSVTARVLEEEDGSPTSCCPALLESLKQSPHFYLIDESPGGWVFAVRERGSALEP